MVRVQKNFITGGIPLKGIWNFILWSSSCENYREIWSEGSKNKNKNTPWNHLSFINTNCSQNTSAERKTPAASRSLDTIKASEMCQTLPLSSRWWSLLLSHLAFNGQASQPASKAGEQAKKTNKQAQSRPRCGGQWQVWLIRCPAGSCHHHVERNRQSLACFTGQRLSRGIR